MKRAISLVVVLLLVMSMLSASALTVVMTGTCNVRTGPGTAWPKTGKTVHSGDVLNVTKVKGQDGTVWYQINSGSNKYGYVSSFQTKSLQTVTKVRMTGSAYARVSPSKNAKALGIASKGATYKCVGYKNGWFCLKNGKYTGWVYGGYVKPVA